MKGALVGSFLATVALATGAYAQCYARPSVDYAMPSRCWPVAAEPIQPKPPELYSVVLAANPGSWERSGVGDPFVWKENGELKMFYIGDFTPVGQSALAMAVSNDGLKWTKHPRPAFSVPSGRSHPRFFQAIPGTNIVIGQLRGNQTSNGEIHAWHRESDGRLEYLKMLMASDTGQGSYAPGNVIEIDDRFVMYGHFNGGIFYSESRDALVWSKPKIIVPFRAERPFVFFDASKKDYVMWYVTDGASLWRARSRDGKEFYDHKLFLREASLGNSIESIESVFQAEALGEYLYMNLSGSTGRFIARLDIESPHRAAPIAE